MEVPWGLWLQEASVMASPPPPSPPSMSIGTFSPRSTSGLPPESFLLASSPFASSPVLTTLPVGISPPAIALLRPSPNQNQESSPLEQSSTRSLGPSPGPPQRSPMRQNTGSYLGSSPTSLLESSPTSLLGQSLGSPHEMGSKSRHSPLSQMRQSPGSPFGLLIGPKFGLSPPSSLGQSPGPSVDRSSGSPLGQFPAPPGERLPESPLDNSPRSPLGLLQTQLKNNSTGQHATSVHGSPRGLHSASAQSSSPGLTSGSSVGQSLIPPSEGSPQESSQMGSSFEGPGALVGVSPGLSAALPGLRDGTVVMPGGRDRASRPLLIITATEEPRPGAAQRLAAALRYCLSTLSAERRREGLCVLVDARVASWRRTRVCLRQVAAALGGDTDAAVLLVLRPDAFWEKRRVDACARAPADGEPVYLPLSRIQKYIDPSELPVEFGGTKHIDVTRWIHRRMEIEKFILDGEALIEDLEQMRLHFCEVQSGILSENAETAHQEEDDLMVQAAQTRTLMFLEAGMQVIGGRASGPAAVHTPGAATPLSAAAASAASTVAAVNHSASASASASAVASDASQSPSPCSPPPAHVRTTPENAEPAATAAVPAGGTQAREPAEAREGRERVCALLTRAEASAAALAGAWAEARRCAAALRELRGLERGVVRVTDWILGPAEALLSAQHRVGFDFASAEELRQAHEKLEMQCRDTYGQYAELLHKIDTLPYSDIPLPDDLKSQRDFMDFVCRSFASRLERRRNVLITSGRFFRLVAEYFHRTSDVFETLVKVNYLDDLKTATTTLQELQDSQAYTAELESEVLREGEKLADLLSMPVKDALGRDIHVNYEQDIKNVHDLLEATRARKLIFCDRVELQKLTLKQVAHIYAYEQDALQAIQWLDDLFCVMLRSHTHVGCSVSEIQQQKEEHQVFQETAKSTYEYGCQLLLAALALRQSCHLPIEINATLTVKLRQSWKRLQTIGQEQMTRLRVSAVFHRSVEEHCRQLRELTAALCVCGGPGEETAGSAEEEPPEAAEPAADGGGGRVQARMHSFLANRERLLLEVGRMVRLGRLLRTRLREPLCAEQQSEDSSSANSMAVEAISEKLVEVSSLAEQLDASLCASTTYDVPSVPPESTSIHDAATTTSQNQRRSVDIDALLTHAERKPQQETLLPVASPLLLPPPSSPPPPAPLLPPPPLPPLPPPPLDPSEWQSAGSPEPCASPPLPPPPSPLLTAVSHEDDSTASAASAATFGLVDDEEDDEFVTASECTCTATSRSASFHTASECGGGGLALWWDGEAAAAPDPAAEHDSGDAFPPPLSPSPLPAARTPRTLHKTMQVRHEICTEVTETTSLRLSYNPPPDIEFEEFHRSLAATRARVNASANLRAAGMSPEECSGAISLAEVTNLPETEEQNDINSEGDDDSLINQLKEVRQAEDDDDSKACYHQHIARHAIKGIL